METPRDVQRISSTQCSGLREAHMQRPCGHGRLRIGKFEVGRHLESQF